ncbi:MAG: hypothetical protein LBS55_09140 [Prevotellaceae bacterium]|jgi:hypothetical protein|nr:hypothetical protein [Prevotellaceae bacterium]
MKKYILLSLVLLMYGCIKVGDWQEDFLLETLFEHNDRRLTNYDAITENDKQVVWSEEFDNNNSKFPFDISIAQNFITANIQGSTLIIDYTRAKELQYDIPFTIDENRNFEVEMRFFINDDIFNQTHIIIFSPSDSLKYQLYFYRYSLSGEKRTDIVFEKDNNIYFKLFDWDSEDYLRLNEFSIITIRKINSKYSFFINHKLFYILNDKDFSCNKSCIVISRGRNIFDHVRISYTDD